MKNIFLFVLAVFYLWSCEEQVKTKKPSSEFEVIPDTLNLVSLNESGVIRLKQQELTPDDTGVIADIPLHLPKYSKGIYFRPFSEKLAAGNRVEPLWFNDISELDGYQHQAPRMDNHVNLGAFMMLQQDNGNFLALLPLVSNRIGNTFSIRNKTPI